MDQIDKYFGYIVFGSGIVFFVVFATKSIRYWLQLKRAFLQSGTVWPIPSQKELLQEMRNNFFRAYYKMFMMMVSTAQIIFFMRSDNPDIMGPIRGIRRWFLAFIIFPFVLAFILIVVGVVLVGV